MKWNVKSWIWMGVVLGLFTSALSAASYKDIDGIVAVVNEDVILRSELDSAAEKMRVQIESQGAAMPPRAVFERQLLERLIRERLQLHAAKEMGIKIDDDTINKTLDNISQRNGMTLVEMRKVLAAEGIPFREFRRQIEEQITLQVLRDREVKRRIRVSDQEVEAYLLSSKQASNKIEYKISHILISTPQGADPAQIREALARADEVVSRLRGGADFAQIAMSVSSGSQALQGGDLGWRSENQLPSFFSRVVRDLEVGEISEPLRSNSGYHIIRLTDRRGGQRKMVSQTRARHILIRTSELTSAQDARRRLSQLRQRISGGADFEALARGHSDDKGTAVKGGELGWVSPGDTLPAFEEQMNQLRPGEISQPFESDFGWHIVQVLERRQHDSTEEFQKAEAREAIGTRKLEEEYDLYVRRLRDEAYVEIRLDDSEG